jgi:hypothetical protein
LRHNRTVALCGGHCPKDELALMGSELIVDTRKDA